MKKVDNATDSAGRRMEKGDTVSTLTGHLTARICDLARDGEEEFVQLRPLHQPYSPGVWHSADRVMWVAAGKRRKAEAKAKAEAAAAANGDVEATVAAKTPASPARKK